MDVVRVITSVLVLLSKPMGIICLILVGLALNRGSGYGRYLTFALIFLNARSLIFLMDRWLPGTGLTSVIVPNESLIGAEWLRPLITALDTQFVRTRLTQQVAPAIAGFFIIKAFIHIMEGDSPMRLILGAIFMLSLVGTYNLLLALGGGDSWTGQSSQPDSFFTSFGAVYTYLAMRVCPAAAVMAIIVAIINYGSGKNWAPYVFACTGLLGIPGSLALLRTFVTTPI